jgi:hypothetical protein
VAGGGKLGIYPLLRFLKRLKNTAAGKKEIYQLLMSRDSAVGIVTAFGLDD